MPTVTNYGDELRRRNSRKLEISSVHFAQNYSLYDILLCLSERQRISTKSAEALVWLEEDHLSLQLRINLSLLILIRTARQRQNVTMFKILMSYAPQT